MRPQTHCRCRPGMDLSRKALAILRVEGQYIMTPLVRIPQVLQGSTGFSRVPQVQQNSSGVHRVPQDRLWTQPFNIKSMDNSQGRDLLAGASWPKLPECQKHRSNRHNKDNNYGRQFYNFEIDPTFGHS